MPPAQETGRNRLDQNARRVERILSEVIRSLRFYADAGYGGGDCRPDNLERIRSWGDPGCLGSVESSRPDNVGDISACEECPLRAKRVAINGVGSKEAKVMFVMGYPAFSTVKENSPYAGEPGRLLARMIAAMKLTPETVYVSHIVRCRPPDGEEPSREAGRFCFSFLEREISDVTPQVICLFGDFAARCFLERAEPLPELRGRFFEKNGMRVMPTWHPDDLIADPDKKRPAWEDLQKIMRCLDII